MTIGSAELRAILDAIPAPIVFYDPEHRYRYANPGYAGFVDRPLSELLGRTVLDVLGSETWSQLRPHALRAAAGEVAQHAAWVTHADGTAHYVERTFSPHRDPDGRIGGYFVVIRDITDLKLHERELAERQAELLASEALNAAVTASALDCVVVIDETAHVVAFNPQAERTFGYTEAEALGQPISTLIIPPHLRQRHTEGFQRYLSTGKATVLGRRIEVEAMRRDGSIMPVELAITEVTLPSRRLFTAYLRDLTEARAAAAEIERQREVLHQREKLAALGSLLAGVAHELNNPLSIVIGQALMLREETDDPVSPGSENRIAERAAKIQTAAERCARIVRTFLAMARQRKAERREVRLPALVDGALDLLGYGLRSGGIEVVRDWPDDLPAVYGDGDQLHQVLINLLINAQQAMDGQNAPRRITIHLAHDESRDELVIVVADTGPGLPEAIRSRIFEPYFTTKPMGVGTGIGLAVSRGMVEAHGGTLTSLPNDRGKTGARFEIRLPRGGAEPAATTESGAASSALSLPAKRALVIDDEPGIAAMLAELLARDGFACDIAASGEEARRLLESTDVQTRYGAILCDLHMPREDGPTLFRWLQQHRPEAAQRVIFVTGDTLGPNAGRFLAESGRPVVEKPFAPSEIRRIVGAIASGPLGHAGA